MKKITVLLISVALVLSFTLPAAAAWNFYGSARMSTFWNDRSTEFGANADGVTWALQGNSRIGANVKGDAVSGRFEYGTGVNVRLLYGTWNFGGGTLLVGQSYSPYNIFISNQVFGGDSDLLNYNGHYGGRNGMLQVSFGPVKIALVSPGGTSGAAAYGGTDTDVTLPKLEGAFRLKGGAWWLQVAGGYQTYDENGTAAGNVSVDSWILGGAGGFNFGPVGIKVGGMFGSNIGNYGVWLAEAADHRAAVVGTTLQDADSWSASGVITFKATDMFSLEGGIAYISADVAGGAGDDTGMSYYVQAVISPAPGVYIIPEVGVQDLHENAAGVDEGSTTYFGAKWQINFGG